MGRRKLFADADLLGIGRQVFIEHGAAASTREIARRAGVSEAVIYQRFGTKDHFLLTAMAPPDFDVEALFSQRSGVARTDVEGIALGILGYFRELVPVLVPLLADPAFDFEEFARLHQAAPMNQLRIRLVAHLGELRARGEIEARDVPAAGLLLFGALFSLAVFERLSARYGNFADGLVRSMVGALWTGLRAS
ncbi:MAG: TetR/AcrR family transcriptional regulator [Dehalococcoidia bacterium]|nr:TetR/AcrR family transcriptional regulator [Dehalococcoidia bacterium]